MRKVSILLCCSTVLLLLITTISAQQRIKTSVTADDWVGEYKYVYSESATSSGDVPVIEYVLMVSRKGDTLTAHFTADGYQTYDKYSCSVKTEGNQLNIHFLEDLENTDSPGNRKRLKKGQLLGSLLKITSRRKHRYQYKNGSYQISFNSRSPVYFKKTK